MNFAGGFVMRLLEAWLKTKYNGCLLLKKQEEKNGTDVGINSENLCAAGRLGGVENGVRK